MDQLKNNTYSLKQREEIEKELALLVEQMYALLLKTQSNELTIHGCNIKKVHKESDSLLDITFEDGASCDLIESILDFASTEK